MTNTEYKMIVKNLTSIIFTVHTSMTVGNEEIEKLFSNNSKLERSNEDLEIMMVNTHALKKELEYLKNKIVYA